MTDPERLSLRSTGLAAELLRAAAEEQPDPRGMQQTLLACGVSGVILSTASVASAGSAQLASAISTTATASGVGAAASGTVGTVSAVLVAKWVGIGVLGGFSLAGAAAVATLPPPRAAETHTSVAAPRVARTTTTAAPSARSAPLTPVVASSPPGLAATATQPRVAVVETRAAAPQTDDSAPLAAEVEYVDRARALLAAGQVNQGLSLLAGYEQQFREARLLPEVLFLQLEACERAGRPSEARRAAQRLVSGFPTSPHAGRARALLGE